jgi:ankyrin repeat protein
MRKHRQWKQGKVIIVVFMVVVFSILACSDSLSEDLVNAAKKGDAKTIERLLEKGADVNAEDSKYDATALMWAAHNGHEAAVRILLHHGAAIDKQCKQGESALWFAAQKGQLETLRILSESGADINVIGRNGDSALVIAKKNGHKSIFDYLIQAGAKK